MVLKLQQTELAAWWRKSEVDIVEEDRLQGSGNIQDGQAGE